MSLGLVGQEDAGVCLPEMRMSSWTFYAIKVKRVAMNPDRSNGETVNSEEPVLRRDVDLETTEGFEVKSCLLAMEWGI